MLREEVTGNDIAKIVSKRTCIPVSKLQPSKMEKLLHLEEELHKCFVDQDPAVNAIAKGYSAISRWYLRSAPSNR
jgi:ATP-dependent Clp protease ATP-binding subunit ClpB